MKKIKKERRLKMFSETVKVANIANKLNIKNACAASYNDIINAVACDNTGYSSFFEARVNKKNGDLLVVIHVDKGYYLITITEDDAFSEKVSNPQNAIDVAIYIEYQDRVDDGQPITHDYLKNCYENIQITEGAQQ